eukprot:1807081-Pleurochrysis_carterae.AAC.1
MRPGRGGSVRGMAAKAVRRLVVREMWPRKAAWLRPHRSEVASQPAPAERVRWREWTVAKNLLVA